VHATTYIERISTRKLKMQVTWPPELQEPGAQSMPAEVDSGQYLPAGQATQDDFVTSGMRPAAHSEHKPAPAVLQQKRSTGK
jgi:hypothetical protein